MAAAPAATGPVPSVWHEPVPADLAPFPGQNLVAIGMELWNTQWGVPRDWAYILWDWTDEHNVLRCRYCGWVEICWNPGGGWLGWPPQVPFHGSTQRVMEVKTRPGRNTLVMLDGRRADNMNLLYRCQFVGCYLPTEAQPVRAGQSVQ